MLYSKRLKSPEWALDLPSGNPNLSPGPTGPGDRGPTAAVAAGRSKVQLRAGQAVEVLRRVQHWVQVRVALRMQQSTELKQDQGQEQDQDPAHLVAVGGALSDSSDE